MTTKRLQSFNIALMLVSSFLVMLLLIVFLPRHGEVVYNCSIAEISPDFPPEVREQCRKLYAEAYKKEHSK